MELTYGLAANTTSLPFSPIELQQHGSAPINKDRKGVVNVERRDWLLRRVISKYRRIRRMYVSLALHEKIEGHWNMLRGICKV